MSKQNNLTDFLTDVANAIRAKKGSTDLINPQNFSAEIAALSGGLEVIEMTETTATIEPNKVYIWGMVESLNITLGASTNENDFFAFRFRCSKPTMTSLTVNGATWADDTELDEVGKPILDLGSWYQCEIKGGTSALYARLAHYIPFADSNVEAVLLAKGVGDGVGVTYKDASKVTDIATWFSKNDVITSFLEFFNFTGISEIKANAFSGCTALTQIALPAPVTDIGISAFNGCISLTNVVLPESLPKISNTAFNGCTALEEISLPASLTTILNAVFKGCSSLKRVYGFENTQVTSIKNETFNNCSSLAEIALPASLTSIGNYAFGGCSALTKADLSSTQVTSVGNGAFFKCSSLAEIVFPTTLTSIGQSAFNGCSSLAEIALPASLTSIRDSAFYNCTSLAGITFPDALTSIEGYAFYGCSLLARALNLENTKVTSIRDSAFYNCTSLAGITFPDALTSIGDRAFYNCSSLTEITFPDTLTSIGNTAFLGCKLLERVLNLENTKVTSITGTFNGCASLTGITLPASLTSIGSSAFYGCTSLQYIRIEATTPPTLSSSFPIPSKIGAIYVPDESVAAYQAATNWSSFASKIKGISEMPA